MYTQCPECKKIRTITVSQLRETRAISYCENCTIKFDALELLSAGSPPVADENDPLIADKIEQTKPLPIHFVPEMEENNEPLPWEQQEPSGGSALWAVGCVFGMLLLLTQFYYFEYQHIVQIPRYRIFLQQICARLHCHIPVYRNPGEIKVLHGSLQAETKNSYQLRTVFTNQAVFPQPYPKIKLTLRDYSGISFASRIFSVADYLPGRRQKTFIAPDETVEISLSIVKPVSPIGGYTVELI